jgi:S1-C subfamily serine protease
MCLQADDAGAAARQHRVPCSTSRRGALVDLSGRVVGVPTLAALNPEFGNAQAEGIGFAIPSNTVRRVADGLIASSE